MVEVDKAFLDEKRFFTLSSFSIAVPYLPLVAMLAFIFGYGAKLVRDGEIMSGPTVLRVFFGVVHCAEGFGEVGCL
jgi:hypothetical protein